MPDSTATVGQEIPAIDPVQCGLSVADRYIGWSEMRRHLDHISRIIKFENIDHINDQDFVFRLVDFGPKRESRGFGRNTDRSGQFNLGTVGKGSGVKLQDIIAALRLGADRVFDRDSIKLSRQST